MNDLAMTTEDKISALKILFSVGWANKAFSHYRNMECDYVDPYSFWDKEYLADDGARPYVILGNVASGTDSFDQTTTWQRSNYRRLTEDYPDVWTIMSYSNVDALGAFVDDLPDDLVDTLCGLASDYPIYDESDVSSLEDDEVTESWDQYLAWDIRRELTEDEQDAWDEADATALRDAFWTALQEADYYPEHNGIDVVWNDEIVMASARQALAMIKSATS